MVYPFQRYIFQAHNSPKELSNRFFLLLQQKQEISFGKSRRWTKKAANPVMFSGFFDGSSFELTSHRKSGGEDLVKFSGQVTPEQRFLKVEVHTGLTSNALTTVLLGVVIALVLAYGYIFFAERMSMISYLKEEILYLIFPVLSLYISLKRYSTKATALMEQLIYWLEMEESE